eukprot:TRINITY_DN2469_c0_g1_i1.p1 TRINITY_DN2469_c0_g1~~TRINITY_DN2469_c0_g1_i1.p1  ORF type:complete len:132 (+),score=21.99 TRINITY_DN2469_c0_g1_i1:1-396(+)
MVLKGEEVRREVPVARELVVDADEEDEEEDQSRSQCCPYKDLYHKELQRNKELRAQQVVLLGFLDKFITSKSSQHNPPTPPHVSPIPSSSPSLSSVGTTPPSVTRHDRTNNTRRKACNIDTGPIARCPKLK